MSRPIIIFGCNSFASLIWYCVTHDTIRKVIAFTVDNNRFSKNKHEKLPVITFEKIANEYQPELHEILVPIGWTEINGIRRSRFEKAKQMGYNLGSYISSHATVWPDTLITENCMIFEKAVVQPFVQLGENIIIRSGANIGHHSIVGNHCFIASGVVTGGNVHIGEQCFIGLGATLRDNIHIAPRCLIGAGAVVLSDTEPDGVYVGNPARRISKTSLEATMVKNG